MKRGRPRKTEDTAGITGAMLQRARAISLHPILETPFGQLAFQGYFTDYQIAAAEKVQEIYNEHDKHIGLSRSAASPVFELGYGRSAFFEDDLARERAEKAKRDFERLQKEISPLSRYCRTALEELLIQKRACPPLSLPQVRQALDYLADRFGYKIRKKRLDISKRVTD